MTAASVTPAGLGAAQPAEVNWTRLLWGFTGMVIGQFMAILDIQIVAASLAQVQAGVGASPDQISWVQTAYLIPEVVMIPLSSYLSRLLGTQRVFLVSCSGFLVMSILAGLSTNIGMLVLCRAFQGFLGGAMIPTVFATGFTAFPRERRMTVNIITGMIVTLAPTLGPTLGGHLTEWLDWRWLFFINIGPGLISLFLVARYADFDTGDPKLAIGFDWFGLVIMATFLMSMQYVLEEGAKRSWFQNGRILWMTVTAAITGVVFVWRQLTYRQPIVQLKAFVDRNFTLGVLMTAASAGSLYGGTFLLPLFLARVRGFSSAQVGVTMIVSGLTMFFGGPLAGRLIRNMDPRISMSLGFLLASVGIWMGHGVNENWGFYEFAVMQACRGLGTITAMIATTQLTMSTLPQNMVKDASGLMNLSRNVGGAIALGMVSSTLTTQTAVHMGDLSNRITLADQLAQGMLHGLTARLAAMGVSNPSGAAYKAFSYMLSKQAQILAFGDAFALLALFGCAATVLALLSKPAPARPDPWMETH